MDEIDDIIRRLKIVHTTYAIIYLIGCIFIEFILTLTFSINGGEPSGLEYFVFIMYFTIISCILLMIADIYILWAIRDIKHPIYFVPVAIITCVIAAIATIYIDVIIGSFFEMKIEDILFKI